MALRLPKKKKKVPKASSLSWSKIQSGGESKTTKSGKHISSTFSYVVSTSIGLPVIIIRQIYNKIGIYFNN